MQVLAADLVREQAVSGRQRVALEHTEQALSLRNAENAELQAQLSARDDRIRVLEHRVAGLVRMVCGHDREHAHHVHPCASL